MLCYRLHFQNGLCSLVVCMYFITCFLHPLLLTFNSYLLPQDINTFYLLKQYFLYYKILLRLNLDSLFLRTNMASTNLFLQYAWMTNYAILLVLKLHLKLLSFKGDFIKMILPKSHQKYKLFLEYLRPNEQMRMGRTRRCNEYCFCLLNVSFLSFFVNSNCILF